ncbi:class I SAM-dependent methyltransferase [Chloroflexota bacterium]
MDKRNQSAERMVLERKDIACTLKSHIGRYVFAGQFVKGMVVLDIACGVSYGSAYLIDKGAKAVIGGDYSAEAIESGRLHYQKDGIHLLRCDAQQMPFGDDSFDVVVSMETIEHLERYDDFLKECYRVIKENGIFICSTPNREARIAYKSVYHFREFSAYELRQLIERHFTRVRLYGQGYPGKLAILKKSLLRRLKFVYRFIPHRVVVAIYTTIFERFIFPQRRHRISLSDIDPESEAKYEGIIEESYLPSQLTTDSTHAEGIIVVASKRKT